MGIWLAVAVAAKGTLVADVVAADTVAGVAPCTMGTTLVAGVMHNIEPGGRNAVCCCNCMLARARSKVASRGRFSDLTAD